MSRKRHRWTIVAVIVVCSGCSPTARSLERYLDQHGGLRNAELVTDVIVFDDGDIPSGTTIEVPKELQASLISELAASKIESEPRAAWQYGGELRLITADGSEAAVYFFQPVGPFRWDNEPFVGNLPTLEKILRDWPARGNAMP